MVYQTLLLLIDILIFFAYVVYYLYAVVWATLQFTGKGIDQIIITIWNFLQWYVNDYDGFIAALNSASR